jgi:hypothetical protein
VLGKGGLPRGHGAAVGAVGQLLEGEVGEA